jgi:DNA-binding NtrC family response regulator
MHRNILIVDDNLKWCISLAKNFEQRGYTVFYSTSGIKAMEILAKQFIPIVLLDIMLGEENGLDILRQMLSKYKNVNIIMITGFGSIETAIQSLKLGAYDYITKPVEFEKLLRVVETSPKKQMLKIGTNLEAPDPKKQFSKFILQNKKMLELYEQTKKFAKTDLPILISGENGTGKEIFADFIHAHSTRFSQNMHKINCAAFPETLLDNELFGHEKSAYTGADSDFKGIFERSHKSSLFLDEIGDMPLSIQAKILRTLQNNEIRRIGGDKTITIDVRFIAATNKNLDQLIKDKLFREDLFYRLGVAMIHVPPLRKRKEDIPLLVDFFLTEYAETQSTNKIKISDSVIELFVQYDWPGNIRELKNTINYSATLALSDNISTDELPPHFKKLSHTKSPLNVRDSMEKNLILEMLRKTEYNKKKTAEILNMSRNTLYSKLEKYGIPLSKQQ